MMQVKTANMISLFLSVISYPVYSLSAGDVEESDFLRQILFPHNLTAVKRTTNSNVSLPTNNISQR